MRCVDSYYGVGDGIGDSRPTTQAYMNSAYLLLLFVVYSTVLCSSCQSPVTELWAYHKPAIYHMNDSYNRLLTSDKGEKCTWLIKASDKNEVVTLHFPAFFLKNSTKSKDGDCLKIYDGNSDDSPVLDKLCDKMPHSYTSTQPVLRVEYQRGEVQGDRSFTMSFTSKEVLTSEKIIRIAGIIGAVLAAVGLTFVVLRATKCCSCLRNKDNDHSDERNNSMRETTRLTTFGSQDAEDGNRGNGSNPSQTAAGAVPQSVSQPGGAENIPDPTEGSDSDSLPDVNELPPSYESLYLNELGEEITPPNYSPPKHRSSHPPRRVHTIN
ncbi:hypothetical protein Btru_050593 [Bulinus truncatus]|nr:hypothetical protein Btru_050593 [Bulinus truncatus]